LVTDDRNEAETEGNIENGKKLLGIMLKDRKTTQWMRSKRDVQDIVHYAKCLKWRWAGDIARCNVRRWTKLVTEW
jgi:hypothetical protein